MKLKLHLFSRLIFSQNSPSLSLPNRPSSSSPSASSSSEEETLYLVDCMEFCPTCGMLLQYELPYMERSARFFCPTCPYVCPIDSKVKIKRKQRLVKKEIDPIISKDDDLKFAQETEATCPNCGHGKAFFEQVQIRSADEPMTIFYKCKECRHDWSEN